LGALFAAVACGRSASSTGSNTNWLERCGDDADCGSGRECWCGACTKSCTDTVDCGSDGQCREATNFGCATPSASGASVCVLTCAGDADCSGESGDLLCQNGVCLPAVGISGAGGSGDGTGGNETGGTGGTAGPGGAGGSSGGATVGKSFPRGSYGVAGDHVCVVDGGQVYCWGSNLYGQLGNSPSQGVENATLVAGISNVTSIAVGDSHTCALTESADVYCWGLNDQGQIGGPSAPEDTCPDYVLDRAGYYVCQPTPTRVADAEGAVQVAVSKGRSCAVLADNTLKCWGDVAELPDRFDELSDVTGVELGTGGDCIIQGTGWQCSFNVPKPVYVTATAGIRVAGGAGFWCLIDGNPYHVAAPDERKAVVCLGDNGFGQSGVGNRVENENGAPAIIDITDLALGDAHACALGVDRKVYCWGKNTSGQVGPVPLASQPCGYETCELSPQVVIGLPPMQSVAAGGDQSCGFAVDGTLWCWGADSVSLGAPVRVAGPWEENGSVCGPFVNLLAKTRYDGVVFVDHTCTVDSDCVAVPLDISCHQTCAVEAMSRGAAEGAALLIAQNEKDTCPQVEELGCMVPGVTCPEPTTRVVCDAGYCTRDDPEHSGCSDRCGCTAVRYASSSVWKDECAGFDLWPSIGLACPACEGSTLTVVITNRGSERFEGDAVISFESDGSDGVAAELPDSVTVSLALEPGQVSTAIHVPSRGAGSANLRITTAGDCNPLDDVTQVTLPSPSNACD
jgi:alpha-tubulin suppressor-like RCC1 family protein